MSIIRKFPAVRPAKEFAEKVAALPYDVMNEKEAREMVVGNPHSFLHVDRAEVDMPEGIDVHSKPVYEKAASNMYKMIEDKVLIKEDKPCLYIYELTMGDIKQTGLVTCTSVDEYLDGTIKKHEFTRPEKEEDRINHVDYCDANTGPIFLAYRDNNEIDEIISKFKSENSPVYDFTAEDGVKHVVWVIDNDTLNDKLVALFDKVPNLYIADGHHRNASAAKVALKRREQNPGFTGEEEFNFYLSVLFPANQLKIMDYNRIVYDLNGHSVEEFIAKVSEKFEVEVCNCEGGCKPSKAKTFGMFLDGKWHQLTAKEGTVPNDPVGGLDVAVLQNNLLTPILNIQDPRTDKRIDFIGGIRGISELEKRVSAGDGKVAFSMFPTAMEELMAVADSGEVMPPKSTWFEPKLRSGLFIHLLK